jgi:hypothetical protein
VQQTVWASIMVPLAVVSLTPLGLLWICFTTWPRRMSTPWER